MKEPMSQATKDKIRSTLMGHTVSDETRERISKRLKGKKPSKANLEALKKANTGRKPSEKQMAAFREYNSNKKLTEDHKQKLRIAKLGTKITDSVKKAIVAAHKGVEERMDTVNGKHENNKCAKFWDVVSPSGIRFHIKNLNHFVREHSFMFEADDVIWDGPDCRASRGLRSFFAVKNGKFKADSWKGWHR